LILIEGQRHVEIPEVLLKILLEQRLLDTFNEQSYSTRKELVRKVLDVKKEETLQKRIHEVVNHLKKQIKSDDLI